jgi:hypothetical protein
MNSICSGICGAIYGVACCNERGETVECLKIPIIGYEIGHFIRKIVYSASKFYTYTLLYSY